MYRTIYIQWEINHTQHFSFIKSESKLVHSDCPLLERGERGEGVKGGRGGRGKGWMLGNEDALFGGRQEEEEEEEGKM